MAHITNVTFNPGKCVEPDPVSYWTKVELGSPHPYFSLVESFEKSTNPNKINCGPGAYRDDNAQPYILPSVKQVMDRICQQRPDFEYSPIGGNAVLCNGAVQLAFGDGILEKGLHATVQTVSGTGALRIGAEFFCKWFPGNKVIYMSKPTWSTHLHIFRQAGLQVKYYRYLDPRTNGLDFPGLISDITKIPDKSIILLQACAHNPTGVDPTMEQWVEMSKVIRDKKLLPLFDMAYQGFATGDMLQDSAAVRLFLKDGHQLALAQSFSKNMGLYGMRVGVFTAVASSREEAQRITSQLKQLIVAMYSNPPIIGARIAAEILSDAALRSQWFEEVKGMADRIVQIRGLLKAGLKKAGSTRNWDHLTNQVGMFWYTGLSPQQCDRLVKEFAVFMPADGRVAVVGVTTKNVDYLARAIHQVTKQSK